MTENEFAPCLNWARMDWFRGHYRPQSGSAEQAALDARPVCYRSPLWGDDLAGLCDTFVGTASCDPLRDEGEAYGRRLAEAGVRVAMRRYNGVAHPFMHMAPIGKARMWLDDVCGELKRVMT